MKYVLATPDALRAHFAPYSRLYAFPTVPDAAAPGEKIILDSGAFGLSQHGRTIGLAHMEKLSAHYAKYHTSDTFCVAPDEYLNAARTQKNWEKWRACGFFSSICPVLQARAKGDFSLVEAAMQIGFYRQFAPFPCVFVSNPSMRGEVAKTRGIRRVLDAARGELGAAWLHVLGAGWDLPDVQSWASLGGFDSLDSVAPYTAAKQGESWDGQTYPDWKTRAAANAAIANLIFSCV